MSIQPGVGYTFTNTGGAFALVIDEPWVYQTQPHPFKVFCSKVGSDYIVRVVPGTINNIEPKMGSPATQLSAVPAPTLNIGNSGSPTTVYIYLQMPVGSTGTPPPFPSNPIVIHDTAPQTSTNSTAYLLLASVDNSTGTVSQSVSGSQWGERYKCGTNDAAYFFGLV
jgi:hypothetical protein